MKTFAVALMFLGACGGSTKSPAPPSNREPATDVAPTPPTPAAPPEVAVTTTAQAGLAPGEGALSGTLADLAGDPVMGATVVATSPKLQGEQAMITDEQGAFLIQALPAGPYTITVYYNDLTFSHDATVVAASVTDLRVSKWNIASGGEIIQID